MQKPCVLQGFVELGFCTRAHTTRDSNVSGHPIQHWGHVRCPVERQIQASEEKQPTHLLGERADSGARDDLAVAETARLRVDPRQVPVARNAPASGTSARGPPPSGSASERLSAVSTSNAWAAAAAREYGAALELAPEMAAVHAELGRCLQMKSRETLPSHIYVCIYIIYILPTFGHMPH